MKDLLDTFKALSVQTRIEIIALLFRYSELCVCDFVSALGETQSKVSRHLRYLYNARLVKDRREGLWIHYRISDELTPAQRVVLEALRESIPDEVYADLTARMDKQLALKRRGQVACGIDRELGCS